MFLSFLNYFSTVINSIIFSLFFINIIIINNNNVFVNLHPTPTVGQIVNCFGPLPGIKYQYEYKTKLILNNNDNNEPAGFNLNGLIYLENLWQNQDGYLCMIQLEQFQFKYRDDLKLQNYYNNPDGPLINNWPPLLAYINGKSGSIESLFVEKSGDNNNNKDNKQHLIEPTHLNLVVGILNALRNRRDESNEIVDDEKLPYEWIKKDRLLIRKSRFTKETSSNYSLMAPIIKDQWLMESRLANDHDIVELLNGWQNVSIESKIYPNAHSKLSVSLEIKLINEEKSSSSSSSSLSKAETISQAVYLFGTHVRSGKIMVNLGQAYFHIERHPCQPYYCKKLPEFLNDYHDLLSEDKSLAKNSISIGLLRFLNYLRINSNDIKRKDILNILKKYSKTRKNDGDIYSTIMDTIAASRHGESLLAALDHINLLKCNGDDNVDDCERFLINLAISGSTIANMGSSSYIVEHSLNIEQLLDLLIPLLSSSKTTDWNDERVKFSFSMTISTLLHSYRLFVKSLEQQNNLDHMPFESSSHHRRGGDGFSMLRQHYSSPTWFVDVSPEPIKPEEAVKPVEQPIGESLQQHHRKKFSQISEKIVKYLQHELDSCKHIECRIIYLHALGNTRIISRFGQFQILKRYAIGKGRRESVAAMRAINDCIQFESLNDDFLANSKLIERLKQLLIRIVYDSKLETTSRLIASELLANYIDPDGMITIELVQHLDHFPSELATMIWKRAIKNVLDNQRPNNNRPGISKDDKSKNWHLHSKILSGSSASFRYVMGGTGYVNASYSVLMELFKGKLPKETLFNFDLSRIDSDDNRKLSQDIISVGLFARGLQSLAGGDDNDDEDGSNYDDNNEINGKQEAEEESTLAGMTLKILGNQLRPYVFFKSTSELMGHLWSGTASEPTSVYRSNLLISDYSDIKPLINGFLLEQSLIGVLSLDLNGEIQVSLWNRNSHSNVQTNSAILFHGLQSIYTTNQKTSVRKMFSFGTETKINFITDFDFYTTPYRICIQITQPEFIFRHNTRKYEQIYSDNLHRRIHRRSYKIPAKSYLLNRDNNEMCAIMKGDMMTNDGSGSSAGSSSGSSNEFNFEF